MGDGKTLGWEEQRLRALERYDILDTPPEDAFDEIAKLAADICGTPIGVVNLIGEGRQFFKAEVGLGVRETPLETSFCAEAILEEDFLLVPDATADARFDCNPLVTGEPHLRFYAGALLKTAEGFPIGTLCVLDYEARDLTELQQRALRVLARQVMDQLDLRLVLCQRIEDGARYRALFNSIDEGFCIIEFFDGPHGPNSDYVHIEANEAYSRNAGIPNVVGQKLREMVGDEADSWVERYGSVLETGHPIRFEQELVATGRFLSLSAFRIEPPRLRQVAVLFQDITPRRRAERALIDINQTLEQRVGEVLAERAATEEALRQAQKMEAVGQLTGGLAHDFNNLLAGITGAFEMIGVRLSQGRSSEVEKYLSAGQDATRRAAALTHRLLAFSRRQTLSPRPVDVNRLLAELVDLVRRTVGPSIEVEMVAANGLWLTLVDANQLENAILNLCINARDAMPGGGKIMIETANASLDHRQANERGLDAGEYVTMCVSDTGTGIEKDVIQRVFDPFFTTKPLGEGTGLGLSMVYGFARQSHGHVRIHSEVGQGAKVRIYLPRQLGDDVVEPIEQALVASARGSGERILIVDDEPTIRLLLVDTLEERGYRCVEAADGPAGLKLLQAGGQFELLITDVGLPGGLNGRQVAQAARAINPALKVLFITGYAENAVLNHDHIEQGMAVVTKPFSVEDLAGRVERLLRD